MCVSEGEKWRQPERKRLDRCAWHWTGNISPVKITADNSLTLLHFLLHPRQTEGLLGMAKQPIHSAPLGLIYNSIGIYKSMFLDQWVV